MAEKVWKCLAPQVSNLIFIYVASYQFLIMNAAKPWVQIHFLQNRLIIKKMKNGYCYVNPFAGARFSSIYLPSLPAEIGFTKCTKVKHSRSAFIKAWLTCAFALKQLLVIDSHINHMQRHCSSIKLQSDFFSPLLQLDSDLTDNYLSMFFLLASNTESTERMRITNNKLYLFSITFCSK